MENLALKYRPKTFDDLVEQENVKHILQSMCEQENLPNRNFLLIGSRGIGKTTTARIMAGQLNGNQNQTIEIDAASHSGVEATREIVKQAQLYPIGAKYKVFIIDEVHSLSNAAWQSLLKVLEEQPAKTVMVLCTTNPEKIPATIISRVQVFQLANISLDGIQSRLKYVIEQENKEGASISYTDDAICYIAKLAKGGMRDSLTLLQKALVYSNEITSETLKYSLNLPEFEDYFSLLNAYAKKDQTSVISIVDNVYNSGVNFVKWFEGFQSFVINIAKYVFLKDINKTMIPSYYQEKLVTYNQKHAQVCLQLSQVLVDLISEISRTEYMEEVAVTYLLGRR